jgi:Trypsin-co-occurring domain 1
MATKLVRLGDGILVEVEVPPDEAQEISGGTASTVDATLEQIRPIILAAAQPIMEAWGELAEGSRVDHVQVELGLSLEGEGSLYLTRSKSEATITLSVELRPRT